MTYHWYYRLAVLWVAVPLAGMILAGPDMLNRLVVASTFDVIWHYRIWIAAILG